MKSTLLAARKRKTNMSEILGDYRGYVSRAGGLLSANNIESHELVQCDTLCIECSTNDRYEDVKRALARTTKLLSERDVNGRLVSILQAEPLLAAGDWNIPYIELLQPKPTRENIDGIDCVFFVTALPVRDFASRHDDVQFKDKGLANKTHPYIELKGDDVAIKFHDRHFGSVVDLERVLDEE
jgi:predicted metalloenzyme YecM